MSTQKTTPSKEEIQQKEAAQQALLEKLMARRAQTKALGVKVQELAKKDQELAKKDQELAKKEQEARKRADAHGRAAAADIALAYQIQERDQQQRLDTLKKGNQSWQGYNNTREQQQGSASSIIAGK